MRQLLRKTISGMLLVLLFAGMGWFNLGVAEGQEYTIRAEHPRIFLTTELLATLRARMQDNTAEWQNLKNYCDNWLGSDLGSGYQGSDWAKLIGSYALAYLVLKDSDPGQAAQYADMALKYVRAFVYDQFQIGDGLGWLNTIRRDRGYGIRHIGIYLAIGYDWLYGYPGFDAVLKTEVREALYGLISVFVTVQL